MAAKNELRLVVPGEAVSVKELAQEVGMGLEDMLELLPKMGLKKATAETIVPEAIAQNARLAAASRKERVTPPPAIPQATEVSTPQQDNGQIEVSRRLKLSEIKDISRATGLSQSIVKQLDLALHNRECQLTFLEGYQQAQRKLEQKSAFEAGEIAAQLQQISDRDKALEEKEAQLLQEGLSGTNHPVALAKAMGIDLEGILDRLESKTTDRGVAGLSQSQLVEKILSGQQLTEDEQSDPFIRLAFRRYQAFKGE